MLSVGVLAVLRVPTNLFDFMRYLSVGLDFVERERLFNTGSVTPSWVDLCSRQKGRGGRKGLFFGTFIVGPRLRSLLLLYLL